jgi:acyl dehydratase
LIFQDLKGEAMTAAEQLLESCLQRKGEEISVGDWLLVDQARIDAFAQATGDLQWIHIDPERAALESPYQSTIAHGFLTLSLLPLLTRSNAAGQFEKNYPGMRLRVNYGLNKVRFPAPVKPGDRIRAHTTLQDAAMAGNGVEIVYLLTVRIDGHDKPACVAEQVVRVYP